MIDRRKFLKWSGTATAAAAFGGRVATSVAAPLRSPLSEMTYAQVDIVEGPLARQAQENQAILLSLDENSLLRPFRERAGMAAPGGDLGGWYDTYAFAPGATFGQWLAAMARFYSMDPAPELRDKVGRLTRGYAATVDRDGAFYRNNRFPSYTYDKLVLGLIDAQQFAHDPIALETLARTTTAAQSYLPPHAIPRDEHSHPPQDFTEHAWDESYTLAENQFFAARLTGKRAHRELARRFLYDDFFFALSKNDNVLPGKHAYSHVNALSSAAHAYLTLGDARYLDAIRNGFRMIDEQSFATGGWGPDEHFVVPGSGALGESLRTEHKSFETPCGAYAHFKLTRYLLRITRDARYGDSMERVLYNTALGAKPIQPDGHAFYYSDYTFGAEKGFHPDRWPCCSGSLPLLVADYRVSAFFTDAAGVYVNLYVPSRVRWQQHGAPYRLSLHTQYPYSNHIGMVVETPSPRRFAISLRIPAWATGAAIDINGKALSNASVIPGTFASIDREWQSGDRIDLHLPRPLSLKAVDAQHPNTVALMAGPLVLMRVGDSATQGEVSPSSLFSVAQRAEGDHAWRLDDGTTSATFRSFGDITGETYSAYQPLQDVQR